MSLKNQVAQKIRSNSASKQQKSLCEVPIKLTQFGIHIE